MDGGKCIVQVRGVRAFLSDKVDITKHKDIENFLIMMKRMPLMC